MFRLKLPLWLRSSRHQPDGSLIKRNIDIFSGRDFQGQTFEILNWDKHFNYRTIRVGFSGSNSDGQSDMKL